MDSTHSAGFAILDGVTREIGIGVARAVIGDLRFIDGCDAKLACKVELSRVAIAFLAVGADGSSYPTQTDRRMARFG